MNYCKNYIRTQNLKLRNAYAEQRQSFLHLRNNRGHISRYVHVYNI